MASQPSVQEVLLKGVKPKGIQPKGVPLKRSSVVKVISEKDRVSLSNPSTTLEANKQLFQGIIIFVRENQPRFKGFSFFKIKNRIRNDDNDITSMHFSCCWTI